MIYIIDPPHRLQFKDQLNLFLLNRSLKEKIESKSLNLLHLTEDASDDEKAVYIFYVDKLYALYAGLTLQPTSNSKIWECRQFFTNLPKALSDFEKRHNEIAGIILEAIRNYAYDQGITDIISTFYTPTHLELSQSGWPFSNTSKTFLIENKTLLKVLSKFSRLPSHTDLLSEKRYHNLLITSTRSKEVINFLW